jgi:hypothetical protein
MPFTTVPLDGALDLQTAPLVVPPGRLHACENFEVANSRGYRRADGYERFDGGPSPSSSSCVAFLINGNAAGTEGQYVWIRRSTGVELISAATIISAELRGGQTKLYIRPNAPYDDLAVTAPKLGATSLQAVIYPLPVISGDVVLVPYGVSGGIQYPLQDGSLTVADWQSRADAAYLAIRDDVQPVPGVNRVNGLFWLKDTLYAARDYVALAVSSYSALAREDTLSSADGKFSAKVLTVLPGDAGKGTLILHSAIGTFTSGALYRGVTNVATVTGVADSPGAGLYKATGARGNAVGTQSWLHQNIGYTLRYKAATIDFPSYNRATADNPNADQAQVTPWFVAGGVASGAQWGANTGTFAAAIATDDGDTAFVSSNSQVSYPGTYPGFTANTFGVTTDDIPEASIVVGVEVEVKRRARASTLVSTDARDHLIRFEYAGSPQVNFGDTATAWPRSTVSPDNTNYATASYGGATNLLGYTNLSGDAIRSDDFGITIQAVTTPLFNPSTPNIQPRITLLRVRFHYIPPQPSFYAWDGSTAVVLNVVKGYRDTGDPDAGTGEGTLFVMAEGSPRAVRAGDKIRSMPAGGVTPDGGVADGSDLVALVSADMTVNMLDSTAKMDANGSQYRQLTANFYAVADFEAIYAASGAGPAFMYDGIAFSRIYTGLPIEKEIPRHIAVHQGRIGLGYGAGTDQLSVAGDPLNFDGVSGAIESGVASPTTGLYPLNGQTLAIFTRDNVQMMQGDVTAPAMGFITPNTGCIEYSAVSSGIFLYTSNRGVESMDQTPAYGDFANASISQQVSPWLTQRVQRSKQFEGQPNYLLSAVTFRNKQQYRLFFKDKKILTGTFLAPGEPPQYTIQSHPIAWRTLIAVTESLGRDRVFGASEDGYVFELDRGNRFDDQAITAWLVLVADSQGAPASKKRYTDGLIHGSVVDYASFSMCSSGDNSPPDPANSLPQYFGDQNAAATGEEQYNAASLTEIGNAGRQVLVRIDVDNKGSEPPILLQAISYNVIPMGDART